MGKFLATTTVALVAVAAFATPAVATHSESPHSVEETICESVRPERDKLADGIEASHIVLADREENLSEAADDLDVSSSALGAAGLAYIRAVDAGSNEEATLNAFIAAASVFSSDVTAFVDAVDAYDETLTVTTMYEALHNYFDNLCPGAAPSPSPSPSPTTSPSPTPSPTPTQGGLSDLLDNLLGGLIGG